MIEDLKRENKEERKYINVNQNHEESKAPYRNLRELPSEENKHEDFKKEYKRIQQRIKSAFIPEVKTSEKNEKKHSELNMFNMDLD